MIKKESNVIDLGEVSRGQVMYETLETRMATMMLVDVREELTQSKQRIGHFQEENDEEMVEIEKEVHDVIDKKRTLLEALLELSKKSSTSVKKKIIIQSSYKSGVWDEEGTWVTVEV